MPKQSTPVEGYELVEDSPLLQMRAHPVFFIGMATAWIWFIGIMWEKSRLDLYGVPGYFVSVDVSSVTQGFYSAWSAAGLATGAQTALTWILGKIMRRNLFRAMLYWSGLLLFTYFAAFVGPRFSTPDTFLVSASDPSWVVVGRSACGRGQTRLATTRAHREFPATVLVQLLSLRSAVQELLLSSLPGVKGVPLPCPQCTAGVLSVGERGRALASNS
jgi:hypothetical protein